MMKPKFIKAESNSDQVMYINVNAIASIWPPVNEDDSYWVYLISDADTYTISDKDGDALIQNHTPVKKLLKR